jgi:hypothetical protein
MESRTSNRRTTSSHNSSRPASPSNTNHGGPRPSTFAPDSTRKSSFSSMRSRPDFTSDLPAVPPVPAISDQRSQSPAGSLRALRLPFGSPRESQASHDGASVISAEPPTPSFQSPRIPSPEPLPEARRPPSPERGPHTRRPSQSPAHFRKPSVSAATRPLHEIGSIKTHRPTTSRGDSPNKFDLDPSSPASETGGRNDTRLSGAPPVPGMSFVQIEGQDDPPRSQSTTGVRPGRQQFDGVPPLPAHTRPHGLDVEHDPYHTPSESISSSGSAINTSSSRSSPPMSTFVPNRQRSDTGEAKLLDALVADAGVPAPLHISVPPPTLSPASLPAHSDVDQSPEPLSAAPLSAPPETRSAQLPQPRRRPAKSFSRPNYGMVPNLAPEQAHVAPPQMYQQPFAPPSPRIQQPPESPLDPAMQGTRLSPMIPQSQFGGRPPYPQPPLSAPMPRNVPTAPPSPGFAPQGYRPPPRGPPPGGPSPHRRATTGTKGNCRGCGDVIKGKSVSSADGRLTGRWHKECFVCKTCREPFQTMDFYVLGNHPYCARHYHELNRSMCAKCDRGIEGHYVETDRKMKYHPHCFTCSHCHLILRDNYFENGTSSILCEQHAFSGQTLGPGRRFPEKRSTRLMMMA